MLKSYEQYGHAGRHDGHGTPDCPRELHHHHDERCERPMTEDQRPWCGARKELGGQQPCPLMTPCDERTCRIGTADGSETYKPVGAP